MKEKILNSIDNAASLEKLYQADPDAFASGFNELYPEIKDRPAAEFWFTRLNFDTLPFPNNIPEAAEVSESKKKNFDLRFTIIAGLFAGLLAKIPQIFGLPEENYYFNNLHVIVLPLLMVYYLYKNQSVKGIYIKIAIIIFINVLFMNLIPWVYRGSTHILSAIHIVILTWFIWGITFILPNERNPENILKFIKHNGDLAILSGIVLAAGMFLTMLTFGLFSLIKVNIEEFYTRYVIIFGAAAIPIVANFMIESSKGIIAKVAPFIAKIFTPLVLIMVTSLIVTLIIFAFDPFNNRDELITYNILLVTIIAIIAFSFSGHILGPRSFYNKMLLALSIESIIVNCIALSAIIYRLAVFGISPNRLAVLGANVLMFINIILIVIQLWKYIRNRSSINELNKSMTAVMPFYFAWVIVVTFLFPFIFWFE